MNPPTPASGPQPVDEASGFDPELDAALKKVLKIVQREHALSPNQILILSSELQRVGVHQLVEQHLTKFRRQMET